MLRTTGLDLREIDAIIREVKEKIEILRSISGGMQCVERNCDRIMAGIKMLELNVSDVAEDWE
jgi:hypothetical protein